MIDIKIGGQKYQLPISTSLPIGRACEILDFITDNEPKPEVDNENTWLDYYSKYISFVTGAPLALVRKCKADDIVGLYGMHLKYLIPEEDKTFNCFELSGDIYYLPERLMQKSTIEDFAEADEFEKQLKDFLNGQYKSLPYITAVICRKKGEGFDDYDLNERAKLFEAKLSVYDAMQVGFFLQRLSVKLQNDLQIYMTSQTIAQLKRASKN